MENFLLRAKVEEWEHVEGKYVSRWVEGYLNLVGITEDGPRYTFVEPIKGDCICHHHARGGDERYVYRPVEHSLFSKKTVSRWTGLYDKKGKKIFEGDIVKFHAFHDEPDWVGAVTYDERLCLYLLVGIMPSGGLFEVQVSSKDKSTFEVIGNRWDIPELVKGE